MRKVEDIERDMQTLMNEYYNAYQETNMVVTPYTYRVLLKKNNSGRYPIVLDGKGREIENREFEFRLLTHLTRAELLEHIDGTPNVEDVFGYKDGETIRSKEELLDDIKEVVDELLQTDD